MANIFVDGEKLLTKSDISSLQSAVAGKVKTVNNVAPDDKGNITIPAPDLSGLEIEIADLKKSGTKLVGVTQAQYDALKDKDPNVIYAIGG